MVSIRLARAGAKKRPFYHVVVSDSRNSRDGRFIERVGFFNPIAVGQEERLRLDQERLAYWKAQGAKESAAVAKLIKQVQRRAEGKPEVKPGAKRAARASAKAPAEVTTQGDAATDVEDDAQVDSGAVDSEGGSGDAAAG